MPLTWIIPLLLLAVFAAMLVVMIVASHRGYRGCCDVLNESVCDSAQGTPHDVLKARYAGGEITKDQFERLKQDLKE